MKKPNLTDKDLKYSEANKQVYYEMEGGGDFIVFRGGDKRVITALLAYSTMIDALIEARQWVKGENIYINRDELLSKIEQALGKAGCRNE